MKGTLRIIMKVGISLLSIVTLGVGIVSFLMSKIEPLRGSKVATGFFTGQLDTNGFGLE